MTPPEWSITCAMVLASSALSSADAGRVVAGVFASANDARGHRVNEKRRGASLPAGALLTPPGRLRGVPTVSAERRGAGWDDSDAPTAGYIAFPAGETARGRRNSPRGAFHLSGAAAPVWLSAGNLGCGAADRNRTISCRYYPGGRPTLAHGLVAAAGVGGLLARHRGIPGQALRMVRLRTVYPK